MKDHKDVYIKNGVEVFLKTGSDLFLPGVLKVDKDIEKGDTVCVKNDDGDIISIGVAEVAFGNFGSDSFPKKGIAVTTQKIFI